MIVVRVELHSAITGKVTELARAIVVNDGTSRDPKIGHYRVRTLRGRSRASLDRDVTQREGAVRDWRRLDLHVWSLIAEALRVMRYGRPTPKTRKDVKQ